MARKHKRRVYEAFDASALEIARVVGRIGIV